MRTILHLIIWDWKVLFRVRGFAFWTLAGPVLFALMFGFMLQGNASTPDDTVAVHIENLPAPHPLMKTLADAGLKPDPNARLTLHFDPDNIYHVTLSGGEDQQRQLVKNRLLKAFLIQILPAPENAARWHLTMKPWRKRNPFPTGFAYSIPAYISMYIFFNLFGMLQSFWVQERRSAFYNRVLGAPLRIETYFIAKLISRTLVGLLITGTLMGLGVLFHVRWGVGLTTVLLVVLLYTIGSVAFGYVLSYLWKNPDAASGTGIMISLVAAALGGNWWPLEVVSPTMQKIGLLVPTGRMMDTFMRSFLYTNPNFTPNLMYMIAYAALGVSLTFIFLNRAMARIRG